MKVTLKGFVSYHDKYSQVGEFFFRQSDPRTSSLGEVFVCEQVIELEVPDNFDPRPVKVAALEAERIRINAEFAKRVMQIDAQIQSLLALEAA